MCGQFLQPSVTYALVWGVGDCVGKWEVTVSSENRLARSKLVAFVAFPTQIPHKFEDVNPRLQMYQVWAKVLHKKTCETGLSRRICPRDRDCGTAQEVA